MRHIRFLYDYRGQFSREIYYTKGTIAEVTDAMAEALILNNRAVAVKDPKPRHIKMTKTGLRNRPISSLRSTAEDRGIEFAQHMKKGELIDALLGVQKDG